MAEKTYKASGSVTIYRERKGQDGNSSEDIYTRTKQGNVSDIGLKLSDNSFKDNGSSVNITTNKVILENEGSSCYWFFEETINISEYTKLVFLGIVFDNNVKITLEDFYGRKVDLGIIKGTASEEVSSQTEFDIHYELKTEEGETFSKKYLYKVIITNLEDSLIGGSPVSAKITINDFFFSSNVDNSPAIPDSIVNIDDYVPDGWTSDPIGISQEWPYEWTSKRKKRNGGWGKWSRPAIYSRWPDKGPAGGVGVPGKNGENGKDGVLLLLQPEVIILNQDLNTNEVVLTNAYTTIQYFIGEDDHTSDIESISAHDLHSPIAVENATDYLKVSSDLENKKVTIEEIVGTPIDGKIEITVKLSTTGKEITKVLQYAINWLGTIKTAVAGDIEQTVAKEVESYIEGNNGLATKEDISKLTQSSEGLTSQVQSLTTRLDDAEAEITDAKTSFEQTSEQIKFVASTENISGNYLSNGIFKVTLDENNDKISEGWSFSDFIEDDNAINKESGLPIFPTLNFDMLKFDEETIKNSGKTPRATQINSKFTTIPEDRSNLQLSFDYIVLNGVNSKLIVEYDCFLSDNEVLTTNKFAIPLKRSDSGSIQTPLPGNWDKNSNFSISVNDDLDSDIYIYNIKLYSIVDAGARTQITQTAEEIKTVASSVTELDGRLSNTESSLTQTSSKIAAAVSSETVTGNYLSDSRIRNIGTKWYVNDNDLVCNYVEYFSDFPMIRIFAGGTLTQSSNNFEIPISPGPLRVEIKYVLGKSGINGKNRITISNGSGESQDILIPYGENTSEILTYGVNLNDDISFGNWTEFTLSTQLEDTTIDGSGGDIIIYQVSLTEIGSYSKSSAELEITASEIRAEVSSLEESVNGQLESVTSELSQTSNQINAIVKSESAAGNYLKNGEFEGKGGSFGPNVTPQYWTVMGGVTSEKIPGLGFSSAKFNNDNDAIYQTKSNLANTPVNATTVFSCRYVSVEPTAIKIQYYSKDTNEEGVTEVLRTNEVLLSATGEGKSEYISIPMTGYWNGTNEFSIIRSGLGVVWIYNAKISNIIADASSLQSQISMNSESISSLTSKVDSNSENIAEVRQTAEGIQSQVTAIEVGESFLSDYRINNTSTVSSSNISWIIGNGVDPQVIQDGVRHVFIPEKGHILQPNTQFTRKPSSPGVDVIFSIKYRIANKGADGKNTIELTYGSTQGTDVTENIDLPNTSGINLVEHKSNLLYIWSGNSDFKITSKSGGIIIYSVLLYEDGTYSKSVSYTNQTADGLTSRVEELDNKVVTNSSEISQTKNSISLLTNSVNANTENISKLEVNTDNITAQVNSMEFGGRNLWKDGDFSRKDNHYYGIWPNTISTEYITGGLPGNINNGIVLTLGKREYSYGGLIGNKTAQFGYPLEKDKQFIISLYAKTDEGVSGHLRFGVDTESSIGNLKTFDLTSAWTRYHIKLTGSGITKDSSGDHVIIIYTDIPDGKKLYLTGVQLERGNVLTDWDFNSSETKNEITKLNEAVLDINPDSIALTVKEGLSIGNRNLWRNGDFSNGTRYQSIIGTASIVTDKPKGISVNNSAKITLGSDIPTGGIFGNVNTGQSKLIVGKEYTLSFYAKSSSAITMYYGVEEDKSIVVYKTITTDWEKYSVTFTNTVDSPTIVIYGMNNYVNTDLYISAIQLELGNVSSADWFPCVEDTEYKMSEIKQTADSISLSLNDVETGLMDTGISISEKSIYLKSSNTIVDGSLKVQSLDTINDTKNTRVNIEKGIMKIYGKDTINPNIIFGVTDDGNVILNYYVNGVFKYGLGPNEIVRLNYNEESLVPLYRNIYYDQSYVSGSPLMGDTLLGGYDSSGNNQGSYSALIRATGRCISGDSVGEDISQYTAKKFEGLIVAGTIVTDADTAALCNGGLFFQDTGSNIGTVDANHSYNYGLCYDISESDCYIKANRFEKLTGLESLYSGTSINEYVDAFNPTYINLDELEPDSVVDYSTDGDWSWYEAVYDGICNIEWTSTLTWNKRTYKVRQITLKNPSSETMLLFAKTREREEDGIVMSTEIPHPNTTELYYPAHILKLKSIFLNSKGFRRVCDVFCSFQDWQYTSWTGQKVPEKG